MKQTAHCIRHIKIVAATLMILLILLALTGCTVEETSGPDAFLSAIADVQSVEASISFELRGGVNSSGSEGNHTVSIRSDGTITSTRGNLPNAYHAEFYSSILVDSSTTRESIDTYVVKEGTGYVKYDYQDSSDEWHRTSMTAGDILSIPRETGFIYDWSELMAGLSLSETQDLPDGSQIHIYTGNVPTSILQELLGNNVFGSFSYSMEQLLSDELPCTLTINGTTMLPESLELSFGSEWIVSDMNFDIAYISVYYSNYNAEYEIEAPKKVTVTAIDTEQEFYSTYYAWNLFLPYLGGMSGESGTPGNSDQIFTAAWNTYQIRIDGGMTSLPLPFSDLENLGYSIDENYASIIMEPNQYKEGVLVAKGSDKIYCAFYNDDTVPQPISNCKIGCIDISAADQPTNGIQIYLPGEVTLGITKEALLSAYGEATSITTGFSCDTYLWQGDNELQSFMVEISPVTGQIIRIQLKNIPVTGGAQK